MLKTLTNHLVTLGALLALLLCAPVVMAVTDSDPASAADVRQDVSQTLRAISSYTAEQRDEAVAKAKDALEKTDARIEQLQLHIQQNWRTMNQEARQQAQATLKILQRQRNVIAEWYGGLKYSSGNAWEEIKQGFSNSYTELEKALEKAREKF
jgi:hypothetical protein